MSQKHMQEQLELLRQVIENSPYLSKESRQELEMEIAEIHYQLENGPSNLSLWEGKILEVNVRAACDEVDAVLVKINNLNPSSPRLLEIRKIANRLGGGEISPEQSRLELQRLMKH